MNGPSQADAYALRVLDMDGKVLRSFGRIYDSPNTMVNDMLAQGRVACDDDRGLIFFGPRSGIGELRAYRGDGTPVWRTTFEDYRANALLDTSDGGYQVELSPDGVNALQALLLVPGTGLLAQYSYLTQDELRERHAPNAAHTVLMDPGDRRPVPSAESWPIVAAVGMDFLVTVAEEPFSHAEVRRLR